jgi:hypothetical protein
MFSPLPRKTGLSHLTVGRKRPSSTRRFRPEVTCLEDRVVPSTFAEVELNNTIGTANVVTVPANDILTTAPADWLAISGSIASGSDVDFYRFTLSNPSGVFFDLHSRDTGLSTTLDSILTLFNANGVAVPNGSNDDGYDFEGFPVPTTSKSDASSPDSSLYVDLAAGTYFLQVSSYNDTTGAYQLHILADPNYTSAVPALDSNPGAGDNRQQDHRRGQAPQFPGLRQGL